MTPPDAENAATGEGPAAPAEPRKPLTLGGAWVLSLAWGYAALLLLACLAVLFGWRGFEDTLDVRRLFR